VTDKNLDYKSATSRRDFTINSMGSDVKEKKLLDPFGGQKDLDLGILRAVDLKKFAEDPLRVLRGVGFCARFEFQMETQLFNECKSLVDNGSLKELAKERLFGELQKILLKAKKPSIGFVLLEKLSLFHFSHTILDALDKLASINPKKRLLLMLTLLSYDLREDKVHAFLSQLTDEKAIHKQISLYLSALRNFSLQDVNNYRVYKLATTVDISQLLLLYTALSKDEKEINHLLNKAKELNVLSSAMPPLLVGKDLIAVGLSPSKEFSTILKEAYKAQMQEKFTTHQDAKKWLKNFIQ
ncbi:MAG: CCA tRNA nucleotidyltransferase, partial [Sulfurimonas sp.]|nr:CCA tRNA nucleotidyltransferase [Sulfurimonas sp.]